MSGKNAAMKNPEVRTVSGLKVFWLRKPTGNLDGDSQNPIDTPKKYEL
jgi:hypothetical protein